MYRFRRFAAVAFAFFVSATAAGAAVILEDDFTNPVTSRNRWQNTLDGSGMTVTVGGGICSLKNTVNSIGAYLHTFSGTKPSVFTLSYVFKSTTGQENSTGMMFCKQADYNGYFLNLQQGNMIVAYKATQTGTSVSWNTILGNWRSLDINPSSDNKLTVSKNGSRFVIFANDMYAGEFTDNSFASGDVALIAAGVMTAVFGPVHMTDTFTDGRPRTSFYDNFNGNNLKYWREMTFAGAPEIKEEGGQLRINTGAGAAAGLYVDLALTDFTAKIEVQHRGGSVTATSFYGIMLVGAAPAGANNVPRVHFGITGNQRYSVWSTNDASIAPAYSGAINGSGAEFGEVLTDTIEVRRLGASSTYQFLVNGQIVSQNYNVPNFNIIGIGVFTEPSMEIAFDNFEAIQEGSASIKGQPVVSRKPASAAKSANSHVYYDIKGRKRYSTAAVGRAPNRAGAAGVYINANGREVRVRKDRDRR